MISLTAPPTTLIVDVPIPILTGDTISMIGAGNGTVLDWEFTADGDVSITIPTAVVEAGMYAWAMKIEYLA